MDITADVLASLIGVAGLAIAAVFSSFGYLYRGWVESKRSARKVLYLLLEIRYSLGASLFDSDAATKEYINHYANRLKEKGFPVDKAVLESQLYSIVKEHFSNLAEVYKTNIEERLIGPFEEALSNLSYVSPVLAYQLRGKEKIELLAKLNSSYLTSVWSGLDVEIKEAWVKEILVEFLEEMESESLRKMLSDLDGEILLLSRHCGWFDLLNCKKALSKKFGDFDKGMFKELDRLIDSFIKKMTEAAKAHNVLAR